MCCGADVLCYVLVTSKHLEKMFWCWNFAKMLQYIWGVLPVLMAWR